MVNNGGDLEEIKSSNNKKITALGIEENICGVFCYLLGFITGIIFIIIEKENKFVRFHALQSIITFTGVFVLLFIVNIILGMIPLLGWLVAIFLSMIMPLILMILAIFLMIKAYKGKIYKLPIAGDIAYSNIYK